MIDLGDVRSSVWKTKNIGCVVVSRVRVEYIGGWTILVGIDVLAGDIRLAAVVHG